MANPLEARRRTMIQNASPQRQVAMLYDRLLLDLERAVAAQEIEDWAEASAQLTHARAIVSNFIETLNPDLMTGGQELLALYLYLSRTVLNADIYRSLDLAREAVELVRPLREAWSEAAAAVSNA